jgi:hypothetical protein
MRFLHEARRVHIVVEDNESAEFRREAAGGVAQHRDRAAE